MNSKESDIGVGVGVLAGFGLLFLALRGATSSNSEVSPSGTGDKPSAGQSDYERDIEALARMLASETSDAKAQEIIGWITLNAARTWRMSVFRLLTGKSGFYGPQKYFGPDGKMEIRYASTAQWPTADTLRRARGLFDGSVKPPEHITRTKPTSYVEILKASKQMGSDGKPLQPETTAERILNLQSRYGGIVGRVNNWFLYAKGAEPIASIEKAARV